MPIAWAVAMEELLLGVGATLVVAAGLADTLRRRLPEPASPPAQRLARLEAFGFSTGAYWVVLAVFLAQPLAANALWAELTLVPGSAVSSAVGEWVRLRATRRRTAALPSAARYRLTLERMRRP